MSCSVALEPAFRVQCTTPRDMSHLLRLQCFADSAHLAALMEVALRHPSIVFQAVDVHGNSYSNCKSRVRPVDAGIAVGLAGVMTEAFRPPSAGSAASAAWQMRAPRVLAYCRGLIAMPEATHCIIMHSPLVLGLFLRQITVFQRIRLACHLPSPSPPLPPLLLRSAGRPGRDVGRVPSSGDPAADGGGS